MLTLNDLRASALSLEFLWITLKIKVVLDGTVLGLGYGARLGKVPRPERGQPGVHGNPATVKDQAYGRFEHIRHSCVKRRCRKCPPLQSSASRGPSVVVRKAKTYVPTTGFTRVGI